jgi:hypothetical protein
MPDEGSQINPIAALWLRVALSNCHWCQRPNPLVSGAKADDWTMQTFLSLPVTAKCPDCQTPEERAETVIKQATGQMYRLRPDGRIEPDGGHEQSA